MAGVAVAQREALLGQRNTDVPRNAGLIGDLAANRIAEFSGLPCGGVEGDAVVADDVGVES